LLIPWTADDSFVYSSGEDMQRSLISLFALALGPLAGCSSGGDGAQAGDGQNVQAPGSKSAEKATFDACAGSPLRRAPGQGTGVLAFDQNIGPHTVAELSTEQLAAGMKVTATVNGKTLAPSVQGKPLEPGEVRYGIANEGTGTITASVTIEFSQKLGIEIRSDGCKAIVGAPTDNTVSDGIMNTPCLVGSSTFSRTYAGKRDENGNFVIEDGNPVGDNPISQAYLDQCNPDPQTLDHAKISVSCTQDGSWTTLGAADLGEWRVTCN
jgi:hypothetical protein